MQKQNNMEGIIKNKLPYMLPRLFSNLWLFFPTCFDPLSDIFCEKFYVGYWGFLLSFTYVVTTGQKFLPITDH